MQNGVQLRVGILCILSISEESEGCFFCSPPASVAEKSCRSRSGGGPFSIEMLGIPSISAVAENPWVVVYGVAVRNRRSAVEFSSFSPRGGGH